MKIDKGYHMNKDEFLNNLKFKIELIIKQFNIASQDMRKILKIPLDSSTESITSFEVADIGCYGFVRLCDCLDINYDYFINTSIQELKEDLIFKNFYVVTKKIQKVLGDYRVYDEVMKKVLIVEDELPFLYILRMMLTKNNYVVIEAINGKEACDLLRTEKIDLIVSDIKMPVMDGFEFLQEFQNMSIDIPFISMSASPYIDREKMISLGASDFLKKPFATETVINCVKKYLG